MCSTCNTAWCKAGCSCYGCTLKAKNLSIQGETVAGHSFGSKYFKVLTDTPEDQGVAAGERLIQISKEMQAGGAVAEDRLQGENEREYKRANDAARALGATGTVPKAFQ